ncbi:MAG TPA: 50S ribosomal protein L15 [Chlamydiales bacterium]|nr:50S ribosomal protein L15 [Chlamydiales bacterium]
MFDLSNLKDTSRPVQSRRRVGRGTGSKRGKTSGRGGKGDSARQGYCKRFGYEGGQVPLYRKLPIRGFTRGTFVKPSVAISLTTLDDYFQDGETVNLATLREKKMIPRRLPGGVKILAGKLTKKITIEARGFSASAIATLEKENIQHTIIS